MEYRRIGLNELTPDLFHAFERHQVVQDCWRKVEGMWTVVADPFIDQWGPEEYAFLVQCLQNTIHTGGVVFGAFEGDALKGFASVESEPLGAGKDYLDLSSIHVSEELRGHGVGRMLFQLAAQWAREQGGQKLYISAHSAVETQAFYRSLGCVEAAEYNAVHVAREPFDCQMEFSL